MSRVHGSLCGHKRTDVDEVECVVNLEFEDIGHTTCPRQRIRSCGLDGVHSRVRRSKHGSIILIELCCQLPGPFVVVAGDNNAKFKLVPDPPSRPANGSSSTNSIVRGGEVVRSEHSISATRPLGRGLHKWSASRLRAV